MSLLTVKGVSKHYNERIVALSDVSFAIEPGEFVVIIGSSGAGKSTLLRCINRIVEVTSGVVTFDGLDVGSLDKRELRKMRTKVGMIFQHYNLVNRLCVLENVLHGRLGYKSTWAGALGIYSEEEKAQALRVLRLVGLEEQVYQRCDQLSGGQKQRVGIARALLQDPKLLLCDEPISSLDPNASKVIMDYLKKINTELGITCLVNLHQVHIALAYAERIIGVKRGRVVYDGLTEHLTAETIHDIYGSEAGDLLLGSGGNHVG
ncbi:MAG: Phosphate-import ATP-binding protein PhnC [Firmicutes bacterium]|nr:Phosphate-import ATP-binding protein PhnC [Bacillota bacterium]MBT9152115.1 Phosphate-import ATP-binding protein PhnC [Bacillota bacterium]MBT9157603.1 Phosphate-import ATP-binding protein PhnC [Bacillota bacterium]